MGTQRDGLNLSSDVTAKLPRDVPSLEGTAKVLVRKSLPTSITVSPMWGYTPIAILDADLSLEGSQIFELGYGRDQLFHVDREPANATTSSSPSQASHAKRSSVPTSRCCGPISRLLTCRIAII